MFDRLFLRPEALARHQAGAFFMLFPTVRTLVSHSCSSHSLTNVTAEPFFPARAVRPMRWMYSSAFCGTS